jgi:hypothetical protein
MDPDAADKALAEALIKTNQFKSYERALAAARTLREAEKDDE